MATVGANGDFTIFEEGTFINRLYIVGGGSGQGRIGIGTTVPAAKLE